MRRSLAKTFTHYNQLVNVVFFAGFLYPIGLMYAYFQPHNLNIGWENLLYLVLGGMIFPVYSVLAFKANKELDVGFFTVLGNLSPVVTISVAWLLLNERLSSLQLVGAALLIFSAVVVGLPNVNTKKVHKAHVDAVIITLVAVCLLGLGIVFERFMLTRMDFGSYIIYGWGLQSVMSVGIGISKKVSLKPLKLPGVARPIVTYGLVNTLKAICFITALNLSQNASLVGAATSFVTVLVVISAYFILKEQEAFWLKVTAAALSTIGLILL